MTCLDVREQLPELAIGVLPVGEREAVERHLRWCAGCRKEASELGHAAAAFAFALPPVQPTPGLDDRVVERVRVVAGHPGSPRRVRAAAASIAATMVAIGSLGWGAVMAGRAERFQDRAERAEAARAAALARFQPFLVGVVPGLELPEEQTYLGRLTPTAKGQGGGAVLQLVSPHLLDLTIVIVNGLDPNDAGRLPYRIELVNVAGQVIRAGRISELDADGGADVVRQYTNRDLRGYSTVRVLDAAGVVVLEGEVETDALGEG